jgi:hypothetical protein
VALGTLRHAGCHRARREADVRAIRVQFSRMHLASGVMSRSATQESARAPGGTVFQDFDRAREEVGSIDVEPPGVRRQHLPGFGHVGPPLTSPRLAFSLVFAVAGPDVRRVVLPHETSDPPGSPPGATQR